MLALLTQETTGLWIMAQLATTHKAWKFLANTAMSHLWLIGHLWNTTSLTILQVETLLTQTRKILNHMFIPTLSHLKAQIIFNEQAISLLDTLSAQLAQITGQQPIQTASLSTKTEALQLQSICLATSLSRHNGTRWQRIMMLLL